MESSIAFRFFNKLCTSFVKMRETTTKSPAMLHLALEIIVVEFLIVDERL